MSCTVPAIKTQILNKDTNVYKLLILKCFKSSVINVVIVVFKRVSLAVSVHHCKLTLHPMLSDIDSNLKRAADLFSKKIILSV